MSYADLPYQDLLAKLVDLSSTCEVRPDRTGTGTVNVFGHQMRFDLSKGFPLLTTKKVHFPSVVSELLWFLKGDTNIKYLLDHKNHIWTDWRYKEYLEHAKDYEGIEEPISMKEFEQLILSNPDVATAYGDIGKGYGHQWRNFGEVSTSWIPVEKPEGGFAYRKTSSEASIVKGFDQISWVINEIKTNPTSRRLIVSGWNPHEADKVDLPPCHTLFQFFVQDGKLSCQLYQRSADVFLGVPFNIASYALLTQIIAQVCELELGDFVWTSGDVHLYSNHIKQAQEQLANDPHKYGAPTVRIANKGIFELEPSDIELVGYESYPTIKAPVAV